MYTPHIRIVCLSLILLFPLVGCQEGSIQKYRQMDAGTAISPAGELPIGSAFINFKYCDPEGRIRSLSNIKGNFTVLAFTSCHGDYSPALTHLSDYVGDKSNWILRVVGVDIFWTPEGCVPPAQCAALPEYAGENFFAICDGNGLIRQSYNVRDSGRYFIIGPEGRIIAKGDLCNLACLHETLSENIDEYLHEKDMEMKENGL